MADTADRHSADLLREPALHDSETDLAIELADARQLQYISSRLIEEDHIDALYDEILDAARALMRSDFASLQVLVPERKALLLLAHKGFDPDCAAFWQWVPVDHSTPCGLAMVRNERVIVPDTESWELVAGTDDLAHFRLSGIRAIQATRLVSRKARVVGMLSTHWRQVHQPAERELRLFDVLARQAADIIERRTVEAALRAGEERQAFLLTLSDTLRPLGDPAVIEREAIRLLGDFLDADHTYYAEMRIADDYGVVRHDHVRNGATSFVAEYRLSALPFVVPLYQRSQRIVIDDVFTSPLVPEADRETTAASHRAWIAVPVVKDGLLVGCFCVAMRQPRSWSTREEELVAETGERVWAAIERARAEAALRESEDRLRRLNERLEERVRARTVEIKALFDRLITAQEEERRRIARDIHDQLGQQMTALRMNIEALRSQSDGNAALATQAERTQRLTEELDQSIDFITWQLRPAALDHLGLSSALHNLATGWGERFGITVDFGVAEVDDVRFTRDVEANLYRIAQEALNNVAKHAQASHVTILLTREGRDTVLLVEDNGRGFASIEEQQRQLTTGLGLVSMRERASLVGGQIEIESKPRRGTSIYVRIPEKDGVD